MAGLLIRGGRLYDGTGRPGYEGDIFVENGFITGLGSNLNATGHQLLDAAGLAVAPGFIDIHSHSDGSIFDVPLANSKVMQGVTTEVVCNCGIGPFPVSDKYKRDLENYLDTMEDSLPSTGIDWSDFAGFAAAVEKAGCGVNIAPLVAHGALRLAVMGPTDRPATTSELASMRQLLDASLVQGAWGMSTGLIYPPGSFADKEELHTLGSVLAAHDALYASHIRGESKTLLSAVAEAIDIVATAGCRGLISHLKAIGKEQWGQALTALEMLKTARANGVRIWADQYPYAATSTTLTALLPGWVHDGGPEAMICRLRDAALASNIKKSIKQELEERGGPEAVAIASVRSGANAAYVGQNVKDIATKRGLDPVDAIIALLCEERGAVNAIYFSLGAVDLEGIMASDIVAVGSDGQAMDPNLDGAQQVHPRAYGTFPRVLGRYVREQKLLTVEAAIYKMTGLPAAILGFPDRGTLRVGAKADLVVFDPAQIGDRADFLEPHQYPEGIQHVLVNGTKAVTQGRLTGTGKGEVLRK